MSIMPLSQKTFIHYSEIHANSCTMLDLKVKEENI